MFTSKITLWFYVAILKMWKLTDENPHLLMWSLGGHMALWPALSLGLFPEDLEKSGPWDLQWSGGVIYYKEPRKAFTRRMDQEEQGSIRTWMSGYSFWAQERPDRSREIGKYMGAAACQGSCGAQILLFLCPLHSSSLRLLLAYSRTDLLSFVL